MSGDTLLRPHPTIDTEALEEEIQRALESKIPAGVFSEGFTDLLYDRRLSYEDESEDDPLSLHPLVADLLEMPPLEPNFQPLSIHKGVGFIIQAVKKFAIWAVRGLVQDLAVRQNLVNQTEATLLDRMVTILDNKADRHVNSALLGFDRAAFYQALTYPEPFPVDYLARLVPSGSRLWELGAGDGVVLQALDHAHGLGVEISPGMVQAAERAGHTVIQQDLMDFLSERQGEQVDIIVLSRIVDHLAPGLLVNVLATTKRHLAPGGKLLICSGPRDYIERDILIWRFYPCATLQALLQLSGWTVSLHEPGRPQRHIGVSETAEPAGWYILEAKPTDA